jgi:hypothetical protein
MFGSIFSVPSSIEVGVKAFKVEVMSRLFLLLDWNSASRDKRVEVISRRSEICFIRKDLFC